MGRGAKRNDDGRDCAENTTEFREQAYIQRYTQGVGVHVAFDVDAACRKDRELWKLPARSFSGVYAPFSNLFVDPLCDLVLDIDSPRITMRSEAKP